jgi:recombination protein RecR
LGGVIFGGTDSANLKIAELLDRIKKEQTAEIILATNPTTEGDATALYLKRQIKDLNLPIHPVKPGEAGAPTAQFNRVKISRLAKGLATGGDIEYADEATLSAALTNRRELL